MEAYRPEREQLRPQAEPITIVSSLAQGRQRRSLRYGDSTSAQFCGPIFNSSPSLHLYSHNIYNSSSSSLFASSVTGIDHVDYYSCVSHVEQSTERFEPNI